MPSVSTYLEDEVETSASEHMLRLYREAAQVTGEILAQARAGDWPQVMQLGEAYLNTIDRIRALGPVPPLDAEARTRKHALLVSILENNARTQSLVRPGLERLGQLIGTMRRQQALTDAYGRPDHPR